MSGSIEIHEIARLTERLDKLEEFIWNNHVEPNCEYKSDHKECSAGLAPRCDQDVCPVFRIKY